MALEDHAFRTRPAYDMASLARAMRDGVGAGGATFDLPMPRYRLSDREIAALAAYLRRTGARRPPPGLDAGVVHLATAVAPDVPERQQQAMLDVLERCTASHSPAEGSGRRAWKLHAWRLDGPASGRRRQLAEHQRRTPAFAMVGGIGRDWAPVHDFCEAEGMPCLLPPTPTRWAWRRRRRSTCGRAWRWKAGWPAAICSTSPHHPGGWCSAAAPATSSGRPLTRRSLPLPPNAAGRARLDVAPGVPLPALTRDHAAAVADTGAAQGLRPP